MLWPHQDSLIARASTVAEIRPAGRMAIPDLPDTHERSLSERLERQAQRVHPRMRHFLTQDRLLEAPIPRGRARGVGSRCCATTGGAGSGCSRLGTLPNMAVRSDGTTNGGWVAAHRELVGWVRPGAFAPSKLLGMISRSTSKAPHPEQPRATRTRAPRSALPTTDRPAACGTRLAAGVQAPSSPAVPAPAGASIGSRQTRDGGRRTFRRREGGPWRPQAATSAERSTRSCTPARWRSSSTRSTPGLSSSNT